MPTLLAAVGVMLGVMAQATTGFGFSLISAPFLIAAYRVPIGVQLNVVLSAAVNVVLLARHHRRADVRAAGALLVPAVAAAVPAGWAVRHSPRGPVTVVAGLLCLAGVAAIATGRQLRGVSGATGTAVAGAVSGAMNVAAGIGGPPVVVLSVQAGWPRERALPTMQLFFLGVNAVTLASLGFPDRLPAGVAAGFLAGIAGGVLLGGRLRDATVRRAALAIAAAGSLGAVVRGIAG